MSTISIVFIAILSVIVVILLVIYLRTKRDVNEIKKSYENQEEIISELRQVNNGLARFQSCVDADAEAKGMLANATKESSEILSEAKSKADSIITSARELSDRLTAEASEKAEQMLASAAPIEEAAKAKAREIIKKATQRAETMENGAAAMQESAGLKSKEIIEKAESEAREIAGNAYDLAKRADEFKAAIGAMHNIIQGYGNQYLKPTESVLDGLAEEFSYTEAGRELARSRSVRNKLSISLKAATSDYVEKNRHDTAVSFIIDAFNGKVDSILSMVKEDNVGILEQKIKDAYSVVNILGAAFRDTKITSQYLDECLDELKWAVAVIALKNREREEQRAIKERIREEERARREYERAIRDAEKQEAAIRKAIEKATAQLAKANEEQRLKYESQLIELQQQLTEAEERNQRALSMAQQTRSGHVYIISNIGSFGENVYKIGMTRRLEPLDRVRELGDASVPFPFDVHAMIYSEDTPTLETELHKLFARNQVNKVNPRKEFFRLPITTLKEYFEKRGVQVQWTIKAEAAQYRETLSLEKAFEKNEKFESEWAAAQDQVFEQIESSDENEDSE